MAENRASGKFGVEIVLVLGEGNVGDHPQA